MSRSKLLIRVAFEPTRRGTEPLRAAYQMMLPEHTRVAREAEEFCLPPEVAKLEGEAKVGR